MSFYKVEYKHVEETTYTEWIEGSSEKEAIQKIRENEACENMEHVQGIEFKDHRVIRSE
ncbi:hypothetical protein [Salibacterium qingdaonense]|uniref:Uncharacterized protein n=1 Tax=Salibacterium qingdaonense TaxID=266892 RepID=A0A1I4Q5B2_9BACI|nr:hypothetical protein [Salibacterium qingdaonense]SFM35207.1 hypothetical protein SAMN04488054_1376 [Salibacterium qingdaonense]